MLKNFKNVLIVSVPFLLKYIFLFTFIEWNLFNVEDLQEDLLFLVITNLLLHTRFSRNKFVRDIICFIYLVYFVLETSSYIAVSSNFSSSYMYLLLESNSQELREFTYSYINITIIIFVILCAALFFIIRKKQFSFFNNKKSIIAFLGSVFIVVFLKLTGLIEHNVYHNIVRGIYGYIDLQSSVNFNSKITKDDVFVTADNDVLVFVLGESTVRGHMGIYGYNRETTPLLNTIKDSLFIYNNVISSDVFTVKSVPKILTSLDVNSKKEDVISLVEMFNAAGYKTYWLSNQRAISYHDNVTSKIASAANSFKFYNHIIDKHTLVLDEKVLPDYKQILNKPGKKVVFVRLIGTHFDYNKRYPKLYKKFYNPQAKHKKIEIVDHYDNAVLYNDFIVFSLIKNLQKINKKSALLYISDHGENLYDEGTQFFGRSEDVLTKSMFEIPFLLWTSKDFSYPLDFEYVKNRRFMADHTYESICHIFGVLNKDINASKSIFSKTFKERKREVINGLDFDNYFKFQVKK